MGIMNIRRYAKRILAPVIIVLAVAMTIGLFYIGIPMAGKENYLYVGPSIKVNGQKVSDAQFNDYLMQASQQAQQFAQYGMPYSDAKIRDTAVTLAVRDMAFEQEMKKVSSKIKVTNADVDALIKKYLPTEEELQSFMERQGFSNKNDLKKAVFKDIQRQKFIQYEARKLKITVPKADILGELEQIQVSHILIGLKDQSGKPLRSDAEALKRANEVYQKVSSGGDLGQLAKEYSDDPGSKDKGGIIGPLGIAQFKSNMVKEFADASLTLKEGQISKPVKTQFGYHIIKLDSRSMPKGNEYKEKYKEIEDSFLLQKAQQSQEFQDWLQKVYKKAQDGLEILDPGLRAFRLKQEEKWNEASQAYQKALQKKYYKNRLDTYTEASEVYLKLKQPKEAVAVLKKAPATFTDDINYQLALANAYKESNDAKTAQDILIKFGAAHPDEIDVHQKLQETFTGWNLTDLAAKETQIIESIKKKIEEEQKQYQDSLNQKSSTNAQKPADATQGQ